MRRLIVSLGSVVVAAAVAVPVAAERPAATATLRLLDRAPLTLEGKGFKARERVSVTAALNGKATRWVRARAGGGFVVIFSELAAGRCSSVRVLAVGSRGSRTVLKILPAPACLPA
jgi:hypothetical protein